jgi:hypothetical protein
MTCKSQPLPKPTRAPMHTDQATDPEHAELHDDERMMPAASELSDEI